MHREMRRKKCLHCESETEKFWGLKLHAEAKNKQIEGSYFCSWIRVLNPKTPFELLFFFFFSFKFQVFKCTKPPLHVYFNDTYPV